MAALMLENTLENDLPPKANYRLLKLQRSPGRGHFYGGSLLRGAPPALRHLASVTPTPEGKLKGTGRIQDVPRGGELFTWVDSLEAALGQHFALASWAGQVHLATVPTEVSPDVLPFCERLGLSQCEKNAIELAKKHFHPDKIRVFVSHDPEEDAEWLVIEADVRGSVAEVLRAYHACKREWLAVASRQQMELVRFLYNII